MIGDLLPDIPRGLTALAEWGACLVYVLLVPRRLPLRRLVPVVVVGFAVLWGVQTVAGTLPRALWTLGMLLAVATMFAFVHLCAAGPARVAGYLVARAFVLAELVASLHWQLDVYFFLEADEPVVLRGAMLVVIYGGGLVAAWALERRHFPPDVAVDVDARALASAVAIAAITFLVSNLSFISTRTPFSGRLGLEVFYIRTLVDLAGFVALFAQHGQRLELRRAREVEAMDRLMRSQHDQYLASRRNVDEVNRKYHDLKHYVQAIRAEESASARAEYLDRLEESIRGYESQVQTGNRVLDVLVSSRLAECATQGITLTCVADGAALAFVDVMDTSALVGNALDNAVEATREVADPDRRFIRLAVYAQGGLVMFRVDNYVSDVDLEFHDGLPRTTKGDTTSHGYGLTTMRQVAERYGGSLTVQVEDGWFTVRVLLPSPQT